MGNEGSKASGAAAALATANFANKTKNMLKEAVGDKKPSDTRDPTEKIAEMKLQDQERNQQRDDRLKDFEKKKQDRKKKTNDLKKQWNTNRKR
mmetsp:Transcript_14596/g.17270  ORF Transcript_14596/g.17270 Transcript_14596/m.17270 type:complete len:93 (-) Transcript_14596:521-799(-)|eukprot:CAMPEP_0198270360 /NCGR_PEP_ID=MMETSP1447-20131203/44784_1 /TAXON_ID=420782 /ORGANISM="Chaetoceros dichaeta, Strain CCMP1751" /LENGTH=92 /DNA_ID=CAMNT_0043962357 /DNA_START=141 /DNA_END=419 /DNA_ORIENTATION=-